MIALGLFSAVMLVLFLGSAATGDMRDQDHGGQGSKGGES